MTIDIPYPEIDDLLTTIGEAFHEQQTIFWKGLSIMNAEGSLVWYIPDAYLPKPVRADGPYIGHEAVCILNVSSQDAHINLDLYFEDRSPAKDIYVLVPAERTRHVRLDKPDQLGGFEVPIEVPYAIRVRSDVPVIVQYSRLDTTQQQCTLMTTIAFPLVRQDSINA